MGEPAPAALPVRHAGLILRTVAGFVDIGLVWLVGWLVSALLGVSFFGVGETPADLPDDTSLHMTNAIVLFFAWLYWAGMEASPLQATLGMAVMGIFTADLSGGQATFGRTTVRYWARFVSIAIFLVGFLPILFTPRRQALHDMLAGCTVLKR